ncbi:glycerol-3-phosphate dehydrogenase [Actinoplanes octamycinicus]|uniref:Glycerol-3-phosphate dehydrogenase n=1 Tax=Actinoplanes octamycinicus TaxID=135948 RepID=A0A7W7M5E9_9ACTN|nr:glycerol-3-phosphate dehydrogenase/oxidase [Actinoplanes octamycinicus]MBB4737717.1 glycerol-3-phosphate dehydrogenase [Actinoplanes octamycinicus]GIE58018.1 FAD-dependent oxidoreductase [Actinoplanes octamycinicus]
MRDPSVSRYTAGRLSPIRRTADLRRLRDEKFDVLVIGGGVTGAGAAVDAASRGLKVALVEARDFAAGTSSRSSKLIHGGLRYLEQLELHLVHEALTERGLLATRIAPHLVRPVPILVPLPAANPAQRVWQRGYYGLGVAAYDAFAGVFGGGRGMPLHRHLSRDGARHIFPSLRADKIAGAIRYYDGQMDDARLVVNLARTAAAQGAAVVTSARVTGFLREAREVVGVKVKDLESPGSEEFEVRAKTVVAATGVWSDDMSQMLHDVGVRPGFKVRASKGVHLVVPRSAITGEAGLILRTATSVLFVLPWGGHWIIGTTDTDWQLDRSHPAASARDISYLLDQVNTVLDRPLTTDDIEGVYAGLRPLLSGEADSTSKLSREHAVIEPMLGLMLVAGGKYTTYRVMAADVIDRAVRRLGGPFRESRTDQLPLLGADGYQAAWRDRQDTARRHGVTTGVVEHLLERYGTLTVHLLAMMAADPELAVPLAGAPEYLAVEVAYAALAEGALHLDDVLTRRTRISIETAHRGSASAEHAAQVMGQVLGWDDTVRTREVEHYLARVTAERESQTKPDDRTADAARVGAPDVRGLAGDRRADLLELDL